MHHSRSGRDEDQHEGQVTRQDHDDTTPMAPIRSLRGTSVVVDGERLQVEDTVAHAVVVGTISPDFMDYGNDTYWCVNAGGRHRVVRASEIALAV